MLPPVPLFGLVYPADLDSILSSLSDDFGKDWSNVSFGPTGIPIILCRSIPNDSAVTGGDCLTC